MEAKTTDMEEIQNSSMLCIILLNANQFKNWMKWALILNIYGMKIALIMERSVCMNILTIASCLVEWEQ